MNVARERKALVNDNCTDGDGKVDETLPGLINQFEAPAGISLYRYGPVPFRWLEDHNLGLRKSQ